MGGGGSEQEFDEFEMLLGEIPSMTYENLHHEDSRPSVLPTNLESNFKEKEEEERESTSSFASTNLYHLPQAAKQTSYTTFCTGSTLGKNASTKASDSPFDQKLQSTENLDGGKICLKSEFQAPIMVFNQDASNLPDDQFLTLAFARLSSKDDKGCAAAEPTGTVSVMFKTLPNCPNSLEGRYPNISNSSLLGLDPVGTTIHSSPNGMNLVSQALELPPLLASMNELDKFNGELKQRCMPCQPLKSLLDNVERQQGLPAYSGAMSFAPGMDAHHMLPHFPVPGFELSASTFQQPNYLDAQSSPYFQTQQLNWSHLTWEQQMEKECRGGRHPHYLYLQQLQNQGYVSQPIQANTGLSMGTIFRKPGQQHFEMPTSHQVKQANRNTHSNSKSDLLLMGSRVRCQCYSEGYNGREERNQFAHGQKQTPPSGLTSPRILSARDFQGVRVFNQGAKQIFPEKILTRSHGLNSLKVIKPDFMERFEFSSPDNADCRCASRLQTQKYDSVDDVVGRVYILAKDQHGCRFLQCKFVEGGTSEDVHKIFVEIIDHIIELMTDPFGNYLVQKLLEVCSEDQKIRIIHVVTRKAGELVRISCNMHGTRAVQKLIETVNSPEQISMVVSSLKPGIVTLMKDSNGNHVAKHCLQYLMPGYSKFLFDAVAAHCVELATDRHGCCVLQKCLQNSDGEQKQMLMSEITSNALILSQDRFGNYVVQYIIDQGVPWATENLLNQLDGNYGYLSMQKHSSNVVEKCLKYAGEDRRSHIIQELIENPQLEQILQDPYGNYVAQSVLSVSKGAIHTAFVEAIRPHIPALRNSPFGKKILSNNSLKKY